MIKITTKKRNLRRLFYLKQRWTISEPSVVLHGRKGKYCPEWFQKCQFEASTRGVRVSLFLSAIVVCKSSNASVPTHPEFGTCESVVSPDFTKTSCFYTIICNMLLTNTLSNVEMIGAHDTRQSLQKGIRRIKCIFRST